MNWLDKLSKDIQPVADVPPKGYKSVGEIAKRWNLSDETARKKLSKAARDGKAKRLMIRGICSDGKRGLTPYYGPPTGKGS